MTEPTWILVGAAAGAGFIWALRRLPADRRQPIYGVALLVAVLIYVAFAMVAGTALVQEFGGGLMFAAMAFAGMRGYPMALAVGWATHGWWDAAVHGTASAIAPAWYPPLCLGFDLLVAGAIFHEVVTTGRSDAQDG